MTSVEDFPSTLFCQYTKLQHRTRVVRSFARAQQSYVQFIYYSYVGNTISLGNMYEIIYIVTTKDNSLIFNYPTNMSTISHVVSYTVYVDTNSFNQEYLLV